MMVLLLLLVTIATFVVSYFMDKKGTLAFRCENYKVAKRYDMTSFVLNLFGVAFAIVFFAMLI
jgi:hypothetical protein